MCPSVSSPTMPRPSQIAVRARTVIGQVTLDLRCVRLWVAVRVQQAFFAGQHGSLAVEVDRSAFEDDARLERTGNRASAAMRPRYAMSRSNGGYLPPGVIAPNRPGPLPLARRSDQKRRPMIAGPGVVVGNVVQRDAGQIAHHRPGLAMTLCPPARICTGSNSAQRARPARPTRRNFVKGVRPGLSRCGQDSQVAACGSHSAAAR